MKFLSALLVLGSLIVLVGASCKKEETGPINQGSPRKVQFLLYTDKDFSNDNGIITFKASIQNTNNQVLWDSALAPMQLKNIPAPQQKIVLEKLVPGNDPSLLKVGFYYSIENVGNSWHIDSFKVGETLKILDFNFQ